MDLVVDANVLFAVLIKEGINHELVFTETLHLFTPEYLFSELEEHKDEILGKTERSEEDFLHLLSILRHRITIVPLEELVDYVEEAEKISPDPDDMVYFALALKLQCPIWSYDRKMKNQSKIMVYTTREVLQLVQ